MNAVEHRNPRDGASPLHTAAQTGHATVVVKLLKAKADIEYRDPETGATALGLAVQNKANRGNELVKLAMVDVLVRNKADVDAVNSSGQTTLITAAINGYPTICKRLIQADANVHLRENESQATVLILASQNSDRVPAAEKDDKALATTDMLLEAGADPAAVNSHGQDALYFAKKHKLPLTAARLQQALAGCIFVGLTVGEADAKKKKAAANSSNTELLDTGGNKNKGPQAL